jgi:hypothetical protein
MMTAIDWNAALADEMRNALAPADMAAAEAICADQNITFAELVEMVVTAPGGALDRAGISVEAVASLSTNDNPFASLIASVMHAARTMG